MPLTGNAPWGKRPLRSLPPRVWNGRNQAVVQKACVSPPAFTLKPLGVDVACVFGYASCRALQSRALSEAGACPSWSGMALGPAGMHVWFSPCPYWALAGTNVLLIGLILKQPGVLVFSAPCGTSWL
jgi:hypothetical protein